MRIYSTILALLLTVPALAVDTLQVTTPDPVTEAWRWSEFDQSSGLVGGVRNVYEDRDGNIWFATDRGVQRYDGRTWTTYTTEDGLANDRASAMVQTRDGAMWFGTVNGLSRFDPVKGEGEEAWTTYTTADGLASDRVSWYKGLYQARDGTLWAGFGSLTDSTDAWSGISRFDGQAWTTVVVPGDLPRPTISTIYQTSDGDLWFGTPGQGVLRFDPSAGPRSAGSEQAGQAGWTRYTTEYGLAGDWVTHILEIGAGNVWVSGLEGISQLDGSQWETHEDFLPVFSLWQDEDGSPMGVSDTNVLRFQDGKWQAIPVPSLSSGNMVARRASGGRIWIWAHQTARVHLFSPETSPWTVFPDVPSNSVSEGRASDNLFVLGDDVWLGGSDGAVRYDGERWIKYTSEDGLIDGPITTILKDRNGALWFAGQHRGKSGAVRYDRDAWRIFTESDGLVGENIANGLAADNGDIWFGTKQAGTLAGAGLMRFDGRSWTVYTTDDGLIHHRIYGIDQTPDGVIWVGTNGQVLRVLQNATA